MRWFIAFLLVANVVLFFWVQHQSRPVPGSASLPPPDIGRLRLMSEVEEAAEEAVESASVDGGTAVGDAPGPGADDTPDAEGMSLPPGDIEQIPPLAPPMIAGTPPVPATVPGDVPAIDDPMSVEPSPRQSPAEVEPVPDDPSPVIVPAVPPVAAETPDAGTDEPSAVMRSAPLPTLAADAPALGPAAATPPASPAEAEPDEPAQPAPVCIRFGPFTNDEADRLLAGLPGFLTLVSDVSEEQSRTDSYYVMIPPLASRAEGLATLKALATAGVSDTWLFRKGPNLNAISLGLFSKEASARRHAEAIAAKGFDAEVRPRTANREVRWLLLMHAEGGEIAPHLVLPDTVSGEARDCP